MRIVATLTTVPGRYDILEKTIDSLKYQPNYPDEIYLTLPKVFGRTKEPYPPLPDTIKSKVKVVEIEKDYGPICKIYGGLVSENDPNTILLTVDDDTYFNENYMTKIREKCKEHPDKAICATGALVGNGLNFISILSSVQPFDKYEWIPKFHCGENGRDIDICFGVGGVAYRRKFFPEKLEDINNEILKYTEIKTIFHNDDVLISGYLSKKNIKRRIFNDIPSVKHIMSEHALSGNFFEMFNRMKQSITDVENNMGAFEVYEPTTYTDAPFYWILITLLIMAIMLIFGVIIFYMNSYYLVYQ